MIAFFRVQLLLRPFLQMRRLRFDEKLVYGQPFIFRERAEIDSKFNNRQ